MISGIWGWLLLLAGFWLVTWLAVMPLVEAAEIDQDD